MSEVMRGIFPVMQTALRADGALDIEAMQKQVADSQMPSFAISEKHAEKYKKLRGPLGKNHGVLRLSSW